MYLVTYHGGIKVWKSPKGIYSILLNLLIFCPLYHASFFLLSRFTYITSLFLVVLASLSFFMQTLIWHLPCHLGKCLTPHSDPVR